MTLPTIVPMTCFDLAQRFVGVKELGKNGDHPLVQWWLSLCGFALETPDETPWCSAMVNGIAWELRMPRSKSAAARSWLAIGKPIAFKDAMVGNDVVILKRGTGPQPGPDVVNAPGHVGFFGGSDPESTTFLVLGGNQVDQVSIARFRVADVLGVRRLA